MRRILRYAQNDTPHSVIARLTKPAEAISGMGKGLPRSRLPSLGGQVARNDIRGKGLE
ncbi:MAG: hypothetical protein WB564_03620 [Dehalococcoidia bacterium]